MLTGIHFLLTYACNFECDHCFLYCSPVARGTFTIDQVSATLDEAEKTGTVDTVFFEGGEPLLFYSLLKESIARASARGFNTGMVTNAYPATSVRDARLWLEPLKDAGLNTLSISNDAFHYGDNPENPAATAAVAAKQLGINVRTIHITLPEITRGSTEEKDRGAPVVDGGPRFRGRAVDTLAKGLPTRPGTGFCQCPDEDFIRPSRVHVDPLGHVHLCQGISMGNMWQTPLSELIRDYRHETHPVAGPIARGGPAGLARAMGISADGGYVDACHLCYTVRKAVLDKFPDILAPAQVYGM